MRVAPAAALRTSTAIGVSVLVHAALLLALAGRALVELTLAPAPIVLTLAEPATRTTGPGELAAELRSAAPAATISPPAAVPEPGIVAPEPEPEPPPIVPAPLAPAPPPRVAKKPPAPKPARPAAEKSAPPAAASSAPAMPGATATTGSGRATGTGGSGTDARSTAPAWAPTARVQYEQLLFAWMERHKQYPLLAQRRGLEGRGSVRVRIGRDGRVLDRALTRSTGEAMLDDAALDMVRRANPFPPVPSGYAGDSFEFVAPIEYRLR